MNETMNGIMDEIKGVVAKVQQLLFLSYPFKFVCLFITMPSHSIVTMMSM